MSGKTRTTGRPATAARRDTRSRRLSDHLKARRALVRSTPACPTCKGTGRSGWLDAQGRTITCKSCRGFGY